MTAPAELAADPPIPQPAAEQPMWRRALPWLLGYGALRLVLGLVQLPVATPRAVILVASLVVSLAVILVASVSLYSIVAHRRSAAEIGALFAVGLLLWLPRVQVERMIAARQWLPPRALYMALAVGSDVGIICLGAAIGLTVAALIRDRNILLPAGVFAAFADYFMVRFGTVHVAMQSSAGMKTVAAMSAHVPAVHASLSPLTMGMADFVFLAFFLACAQRFGMNVRGTLVALVMLLSLLLFSIRWLGAFPAVAPMALGFVLVNLRYFKLTRAEIHATLMVFVLMAGLLGAFFYLR
jgi:hypothetical protein